ncbi:MAG: hypothetical protein ACKVH8_11245 [Pirellulales bacterium]
MTNTNPTSTWRGGLVVVSLIVGILLLAFGTAYYFSPGKSVQYKTQYVLWQCGLAERPEVSFDDLIELIQDTMPDEDWDNQAFETNLSLKIGSGQTVHDEIEPLHNVEELEDLPSAR